MKTKVTLYLDVQPGFLSAWPVQGAGFTSAIVPVKPSAARRYRVEVYVEDPMEVDESVQVEATEEKP